MRARLAIAAMLGAMVFATVAAAQPRDPVRLRDPAAAPGDSILLTLSETVERAIQIGEEMALAQADLAMARGIYRQARADILPQLSFVGGYTRQFASVFEQSGTDFTIEPFVPDTTAPLETRVRDLEINLPTAPLATFGSLFDAGPFASENRWEAALDLRQTVFEGFALWAAVDVAKHGLAVYELRLDERRVDVERLAREAYLGALLADRRVEIATLGFEQAETQLQRVRARHDAGEAAEYDLLQAEVQRDNQIPLVKDAYNRRAIAYLQIAGIANLPIGAPLRLQTPLLDPRSLPADPFAAIDTTGIFADALQSQTVAALSEEVEANRSAVTVAGRDAWPSVELFGRLSEQAFPEDMWPGRSDWRRDSAAGVAVNWALFDGLRTHGLKDEARAALVASEQELNRGRETIQLETANQLGELIRAAAELRARARTVQLAGRALDLATLRYDEGASSLLEVEDARSAFQVAQLSEASSRHDVWVSLARLERWTRRPLFTSLAPAEGK